MTIKYIHIGYPKNLSTSLQRDFFGKHPELMHLGVGCGNDNLGYIDDTVSIAVECYLRYAKNHVYKAQEARIKAHFLDLFCQAEANEKVKAVGLSSEHMSFSFTPDNIDISQKAERLQRIFGHGTKVIMVIRNQMDLIKSLYSECVRVGYPKTYREYIEYLYCFHERNFVSDFFYADTYALYESLFGAENISIIPVEALCKDGVLLRDSENNVRILKVLSEFLGVSYPRDHLGHYNLALNQATIVKTRELNAQYPHDLGNIIFGTAESHRIATYFEKELGIPLPHEAKADIMTKRRVIGQAIELASNISDLSVDYSCDPDLLAHLETLFTASNQKLAARTRLDLKTLGYAL